MEKNLDTYIRRLIELDSKAVAMMGERDAELAEQEARSRSELKSIDAVLEKAAVLAKQKHDEIIEDAKLKAKEMDEAAKLKINELQTAALSLKEVAAKAIWKQLLDIER
ncbi:MAG TPA: hypothetical protein VEB00_00500 [Clostridia bacterium]|nr:hypothetical protein [Clostridia bacterium]